MISSSIPVDEVPSQEYDGVSVATFSSVQELLAWQRCFNQLASIRAMRDNWDDAGAPPIDGSLFARARSVLRDSQSQGVQPPSRVVPSPAGTITIEWQLSEFYFDAEVVGPNVVEWVFQYPDGRFEHRTDEFPSEAVGPVEELACVNFDESLSGAVFA